MDDFLYRGELIPGQVRYFYAATTQLCNHAVVLHQCDPIAAHLLGRALTVGVLTAPLLSGQERFQITWRYAGALRNLLVEVSPDAAIRGLINPESIAHLVEDTAGVYGQEGQLTVVKSTPSRVLRTSTVEAALLDVVEDLAYYLSTSEQIETAVTALIGFTRTPESPVDLAQGILLQALPGCDLELFDKLRRRLLTPDVRRLLAAHPESDTHFEHIARQILETPPGHTPDFTLDEALHPAYRCGCTREKSLQALTTLSPTELRAAIDAREALAVSCHFCRTRHEFGPDDLRTLL